MKYVITATIAFALLLAGCADSSTPEQSSDTDETYQLAEINEDMAEFRVYDEDEPLDGESSAPASGGSGDNNYSLDAPAPDDMPGSDEEAAELRITLSQYNLVENGMTLGEVENILGGSGTVLVEIGSPEESNYTVTVLYHGVGNVGANANFTFQGGKLLAKAQTGLGDTEYGSDNAEHNEITLDMYNKVDFGMTYAEVIDIIGWEGTVTSEIGEPGDIYYIIVVLYEGQGSLGANANFTFQDNILSAKTQFGLK